MINMDQQILDKWVGVRISSQTYKKLEKVARAMDRKPSTLIRMILEDYLK